MSDDIRKQLVLPPAQQIESLTRDVNELQEQVEILFTVINEMGKAMIAMDDQHNALVRHLRGDNDRAGAAQPADGPDESQDGSE